MNNIKQTILAVIMLTTTLSFAQKQPDKEKIKSLKVAFMTEHLDLSSKEAQAFWPIYNEYEENREELRQKERTQFRSKIKNADELSEKESKDILEKYIRFEDEEEALDKAFLKKISTVISAKKTLLLLRSEHDFKRQLIKQYRSKRRDGGGGFR